MHRMPPRITQKSCRPRVSDRTMVGPLKPTRLLAQLPEPKASNRPRRHETVDFKPPTAWSIRNTRRAHRLSRTEMGLDASHNNIRLLSERREKNFLDIPSHRTLRALDGEFRSSGRLTGYPETIVVPVKSGLRQVDLSGDKKSQVSDNRFADFTMPAN